MLRKQPGVPISNGDKIKYGSYVQNVLDDILSLAALATIKVSRHPRLNSLEAKLNTLLEFLPKTPFSRNGLKEQPNFYHVPKGCSPK